MNKKLIGLKKTVLTSALLLELASVQAAVIDADGILCTLSDAITAANENVMVGGCIAGTETGTSADEIVLPVDAEIVLTSALPDITSSITINGNGASISRDDTAGDLTVLNITYGNGSDNVVTLNDVSITNGQAAGTSNFGGGINQSGGVLNINRSQISGNTGGGIYVYRTDLNIVDSIISNNMGPITSTRNAAGLTFVSGYGYQNTNSLTINNSTIAGNENYGTGVGGGVYASSIAPYTYGNVTIINSTISNNSSENGGGGIHVNGQNYFGPNVFVNMSGLTIVNNTSFDGAGIYNQGADVRLKQTLVSGNSAGNLVDEIVNTGSITLNGFNLFGLNGSAGIFGASPGATDMIIFETDLSDVIDTTLKDNGGFTPTHALVPDSLAIDFMPAGACGEMFDQTGKFRPIDGDGDGTADCDVGAFEYTDIIFKDGFE